MSELSVSSKDVGRFTIVEVAGDVDLISAPVLRTGLDTLFRQGRIRLVLDLRQVPFLDSTGLGVLVGAQRAVKPHRGEIRVACDEQRVLRVFSITGLDQVFRIDPTPERALADEGETPPDAV